LYFLFLFLIIASFLATELARRFIFQPGQLYFFLVGKGWPELTISFLKSTKELFLNKNIWVAEYSLN